MSTIPAIKLPSSGRSIQFREATVEDCLTYCDISDDFDEAMTTQYLNSVQVGEVCDSRKWTADDRRLALWWIFVTSSKDTVIAYEYPCEHCGENHLYGLDMVDLDDEATSLSVSPHIDGTILSDGEEFKVQFHPYLGDAMVSMEQARLDIKHLDPDSAAAKRAKARLKLLELAHAFDLVEHAPEDALGFKMGLIAKMSRVNELPELTAAVLSAHEKLKHGLNTQYRDGQAFIVSPAIPCPNKQDGKGEAMHSRLLIPFRGSAFIPTV